MRKWEDYNQDAKDSVMIIRNVEKGEKQGMRKYCKNSHAVMIEGSGLFKGSYRDMLSNVAESSVELSVLEQKQLMERSLFDHNRYVCISPHECTV